ncbi:hypothetical protein DPMN_181417 [Dreissena polymorpha]|uniref:Uncharacterized protein n=1 Tax=Dreissena polymorpha TaxID=45954 RepID=A0A9D4I5B1_DREPO|nr:hypothetical protein DPMN_181417 [Dreissena polymorpha]
MFIIISTVGLAVVLFSATLLICAFRKRSMRTETTRQMLNCNTGANQVANNDMSSLAITRRDGFIEEPNRDIHVLFMSPIADSYPLSRDKPPTDNATESQQRESDVHTYEDIPDFPLTETVAENDIDQAVETNV